MTLPPVVRVFFAVDLPATLKETIGNFIGDLKKRSKTSAIRWTRPENLHITLQFLAEVPSEHLPKLIENVRTKLNQGTLKSSVTLGALHLFPNPYRPRVIVMDVLPNQVLAQLSEVVGLGIREAAYETENRPFRGHLTLGRIKQPQGVSLNFLSEIKPPSMEAIEIEEVVLFRSEPHPEGSKYSVVERLALIQ